MYRTAKGKTWRPLRQDRPLPEELQQLLNEIEAGQPPTDARLLRPPRRIRKNTWAAGFMGLLFVLMGLPVLFFAVPNSRGPSWFYVGLAVFLITFAPLAFVTMLVRDLRKRDPSKYIVVTPRFLASVGDELGVQWAGAWEVENISSHGATSGAEGGTNTAPYIEIMFRNSHNEDIFVDPILDNEELWAWTDFIIKTFDYEDG